VKEKGTSWEVLVHDNRGHNQPAIAMQNEDFILLVLENFMI